MKSGIFGLLRVLDTISEKDLVSVDRRKCMRDRYKGTRCTLCRDGCPVGAITLDNGITIDGYTCTGCGICMNICPNPVFSLNDLDFGSIVAGEDERITISCPRNRCTVQVPCLGCINESILLALIANHNQVDLNITACTSCEYPGVVDLIRLQVDNANAILHCMGKEEQVGMVEVGSQDDPGSGTFTRKLISRFSNKDADRNIRTPRQALFVKALKNLGPTPQTSIDTIRVPVGSITVQPSCNGCGMCAALCPVDALLADDGPVFTLKFRPDLCTGCGLCVQICPRDCMHSETQIFLNDLVLEEGKNLIEITKEICQECGGFFVRENEAASCLSCIKNREIEESFFG